MLDRRLSQDDNRGLGQGIHDNVIPTMNSFRLLVEPRIVSCKVNIYSLVLITRFTNTTDWKQGSQSRPDGYPSLTAHRVLQSLLYPVHHLVWNDQLDDKKLHSDFKPALADGGSDIHVVNLRTGTELPDDKAVQPSSSVSLVLHRLGFDCCFPVLGLNSSTGGGEFSLDRLFPDYFGNRVRSSSLTSLHQGTTIEKSFTIALKPMEIYAFELQP